MKPSDCHFCFAIKLFLCLGPWVCPPSRTISILEKKRFVGEVKGSSSGHPQKATGDVTDTVRSICPLYLALSLRYIFVIFFLVFDLSIFECYPVWSERIPLCFRNVIVVYLGHQERLFIEFLSVCLNVNLRCIACGAIPRQGAAHSNNLLS